MIIRIGSVSAAFLVLSQLPMPAFAQAGATLPKVGYINSQDIVRAVPGREAIVQQIQKEMAPLQARLQAMADSDAAIVKKYTEDEPTLTPEARQARMKEITEKRTRWRTTADSINQNASKRQEELERPMTERIKKILSDIRAEDGLWFIFDVAPEAGGMSIVAIDKNLDLTQRVLDRYKAMAPLALPAPAATGGPVNSTTGVGRIIPPTPQ
jgi:outer membrane protein